MDRSTFTEPRRHAAGIDEVIINGVRVVKGGTYHPVAAGRVLRRGGTV
jgi:N-acyl-D-aspartate/D-glutamate deacylase